MISGRILGLTVALAAVVCLVRSCQMYGEQQRRNEALSAALSAAIEQGDESAVARALDAGADRRLLGSALFRSAYAHNSSMARYLLARGAPVTYHDIKDRTALGEAIRSGDAELVGALVDHGARDTGWGKRPALPVAATLGMTDVVEALLQRGADPNARDHDSATALIRAAEHGNTGVVRALLAHGADPNMGDRKGRTALDYVRVHPHSPIARLLRQAGAGE